MSVCVWGEEVTYVNSRKTVNSKHNLHYLATFFISLSSVLILAKMSKSDSFFSQHEHTFTPTGMHTHTCMYTVCYYEIQIQTRSISTSVIVFWKISF